MKPTTPTSPSSSGGGDSNNIFNAEYTGLPGHHRVLKPPGGGSSDIFGSDESDARRVRNTNHLQSSVFGNMMETAAPKSKIDHGSHTRLFGDDDDHKNPKLGHDYFDSSVGETNLDAEVEVKPPTVVEEIKASRESVNSRPGTASQGSSPVSARDSRRNPINHVGMNDADCSQSYMFTRQRGPRIQDGNPVTGEGYAIANGVYDMATAAAPNPITTGQAQEPKTNGKANITSNGKAKSPTPSRCRVPPGGFSSGLW